MIAFIIDDTLSDASVSITEDDVHAACYAACRAAKWSVVDRLGLCVRISDNASIQQLNAKWRNKDAVTDVLSFPTSSEASSNCIEDLGDIILAWPFIISEARRLGFSVQAHACHLIVHGTLHLCGYDHINDNDAANMQKCENIAMQELGLHTIS